MDSFRVQITQSAQEELLQVPFPFRRQINQRIMKLKSDAFPAGSYDSDQFSCRTWESYGWRIRYDVDEEAGVVTVLRILR